MTYRPAVRLLALLSLAALAACSKSHKVVPAVPAPTLAPGCSALSPQSSNPTPSTYTLTSNPTGVSVQRADATNTQCIYLFGVTQTTDVPQTAPHPWQYIFAPASATPYAVTIVQTLNGPHTLFYNQLGDSSGAINVGSLQSVQRSAASLASTRDVTTRGIQRFSGAGVVENKVLVRYRGTGAQVRARAQRIEAAEGATGGVDVPAPGGIYQRVVMVPAGTDAASFAGRLRAQSDVADVFPVHKRFALGRPSLCPCTDPHANNVDQWYLFADGFDHAWSYDLGGLAKIAIIDTGVDLQNADLAPKILFSKSYKTASAQDTNGHGTNVAGVAAAQANNGVGFAGAGYNVKLLIYNVFPDATAASDQQTADTADDASAIGDAVSRGADVINLSLGSAENVGSSNGFDQTEHDAVTQAIAMGVVVVAAAGNDADGGESGTPHTVLDYPAAYDGVISVGASGLKDTTPGVFAGSTEYVTKYSQYGPSLGVVAPGGDPGSNDINPLHWIWNYSTSTAAFGTGPGNGDKCRTPSPPTSCTAFFAGTSQATPQVSGAAALLISASGGHGMLSPARVAQIIDDTADNIGDAHQGHGRLNIHKAIASVITISGPGTYSGPTVTKTSPTQTVAFAYTNSGSNKPTILNVNYPNGVPLDANGNFRMGDVPAGTGTYRIGVWFDANGNGIIDAGDQFGSPATSCNSTQKCVIGTVTMTTVTAGFVLP
jgi:subtilisin family serine protease